MTINRKDFIKKVCVSGACMCGFSSVILSANPDQPTETFNSNYILVREWLSNLLSNIDKELSEEGKKKILKECSRAHYNYLKMNEILYPYKGNLDKFLVFLEDTWGWKITYDKTTKTLIADENKNYCVCPIIDENTTKNISAICYCSEGFAEIMFSFVTGIHTVASVISSVRKGDKSCKYKIVFK